MRLAASIFWHTVLTIPSPIFELALSLDQIFDLAPGCDLTCLLVCNGRWEEADKAVNRAIRLRPRNPSLAECC